MSYEQVFWTLRGDTLNVHLFIIHLPAIFYDKNSFLGKIRFLFDSLTP